MDRLLEEIGKGCNLLAEMRTFRTKLILEVKRAVPRNYSSFAPCVLLYSQLMVLIKLIILWDSYKLKINTIGKWEQLGTLNAITS